MRFPYFIDSFGTCAEYLLKSARLLIFLGDEKCTSKLVETIFHGQTTSCDVLSTPAPAPPYRIYHEKNVWFVLILEFLNK